MQQHTAYEVILIGGSYAGLAAAMTLGRALRNTLVIDAGRPCNRQTPYSHNFLTQDGVPPGAIAAQARAQVMAYSTVSWLEDEVTEAGGRDGAFRVATLSGRTFTAQKILFATGIRDLMPDIPGFAASWGISILHCPYCHGYEARGKETGILMNGEAALEMAGLIRQWSRRLRLFTNGPARLTEEQRALLSRHQIAVEERELASFDEEKGHISRVHFTDGTAQPLGVLYARLPFVQSSPLPEMLGCALTPEGYIRVDEGRRTSVAGIYAAGDNTTGMRSVASAAAAGHLAGAMINREMAAGDFL